MESTSKANLIKALIKAKAEMESPKLDKVNSHFRSGYSSLGELIRCIKPALQRNGLEIIIDLKEKEGFAGAKLTLYHVSGEYLESSTTWVPTERGKNAVHEQGKSYTYAQRYLLSAFFQLAEGTNDSDNDGNKEDVPTNNYSHQNAPQTGYHGRSNVTEMKKETSNKNIEARLKDGRSRLAILCKNRGIDDNERYDLIEQYTGKRSSKDLTLEELLMVYLRIKNNHEVSATG